MSDTYGAATFAVVCRACGQQLFRCRECVHALTHRNICLLLLMCPTGRACVAGCQVGVSKWARKLEAIFYSSSLSFDKVGSEVKGTICANKHATCKTVSFHSHPCIHPDEQSQMVIPPAASLSPRCTWL
jgi:hypothetical protein